MNKKDYFIELQDLIKQLDVEIASCDNSIAKATMLETKYKAMKSLFDLGIFGV